MRVRAARRLVLCAALLAARAPAAGATAVAADSALAPRLVDGFESAAGWSAHPSDGVTLEIGSEAAPRGPALRLAVRFKGGGYAVAHKAFDLDLPENYAFSFRVRGDVPPNTLEFKLVDGTGDNVWWSVRRDMTFPAEWQKITIKKRQIQFAWGPAGGGEIRHVAAIEFAVTAGHGGRGNVWIEALELRALPPPGAAVPAPIASASSSRAGEGPERVLDADSSTAWCSAPGEAWPWVRLDLGVEREYGGATLAWLPGRHAVDYDVEASDDGVAWQLLRRVRGGNGGRDFLSLPESESRWLRLRVARRARGDGVALAAWTIEPIAWSATRETFFAAVARAAPPGCYPRAIAGEQSYWTVVGADHDTRESLFDEDGRVETGKGGVSVEPFLWTGDRLLGWHDAPSQVSLAEGCLPIPSVRRSFGDLDLGITAFATGAPEASAIVMRYRVVNHGARRVPVTLDLAIRPFQVDPPSQSLNAPGGTARLEAIAGDRDGVRIDDAPVLVALTPATAFGATSFDGGDVVADYLRAGRLPPAKRVRDAFGAASGALAFRLDLPAGGAQEVDLWIRLHPAAPVPPHRGAAAAREWVAERLEACRADWHAKLGRVTVELPDSTVVQSLRAQLGYILVNRAGAAIQPGARSYARSWIRDGALTSSALLRLGHAAAARDFLAWYAPYQYPNGKVPCVVDARGADPVPEHDSNGEFLFLAAEYQRYAGDRDFSESLYPRVVKAVAYLDSLRHERRTDEYRSEDKREFFGLLPPSISHEGYSAKPMHSYWDDFWALRGFADAAWLAGLLGHDDDRRRFDAIHREFQADLVASITAAARRHGIDYIPGCADLGDFDATSTSIALTPVGATQLLPQALLRQTFEKYDAWFRARRDGAAWDAFTPYEIRNLGADVRFGWRERGADRLAWFLAAQRPPGWRQWPEVVWHAEREPHFLGDLPHTWVGSDYVRAVLDMLAYEREADGALVLGAGVPAAWLRPAPGVVVRDLPTPFGPLGYTMQGKGDTLVVRIAAGLRVPPGGVVVRAPLPAPPRVATLDGRPTAANAAGEFVVRSLPATLRLVPRRRRARGFSARRRGRRRACG